MDPRFREDDGMGECLLTDEIMRCGNYLISPSHNFFLEYVAYIPA